jgi:hypothetical protein
VDWRVEGPVPELEGVSRNVSSQALPVVAGTQQSVEVSGSFRVVCCAPASSNTAAAAWQARETIVAGMWRSAFGSRENMAKSPAGQTAGWPRQSGRLMCRFLIFPDLSIMSMRTMNRMPLRQFTITVRIRRRIPITRTTRSTPPPLSASQAVSKVRLKECFIIVNRMLMELEAFSKLQV